MSNHIDHIEITNFKSIRHAKIEGCKRINVFIGYPNVGKSAILEAMAMLAYMQEPFDDQLRNYCRLDYSYELFHNGTVDRPVQIELGSEIHLVLRYLSETEIELKVLSSAGLLGGAVREIKGITFRKGSKSSSHTGYNSLEQTLLRQKVKKYFFAGKYNEQKTNGKTLFVPFGENLVDVVQLNKSLNSEVKKMFEDYGLRLLIDPSTNSIKGFRESLEGDSLLIPYHQMADTLQRLIFHKAAILSNSDTVLLFEEPEAHMFPPYISKFTGDVIYDKNSNQYFIATHSPFVMNDFLEDARGELSVYLVGLKDGATTIKRLTDEDLYEVYQHGVDLFYNIESYLD